MKITGRSVVFAIAGAALVVGGLAAPATADSSQLNTSASASGATFTVHHRGDGTQPPAALGDPEEWGVATFTMDDSAGSITPKTIVPASGGTWSYGWYLVNNGTHKYCYSNYFHNTKDHRSTVVMAGHTVKNHAAAGWTSNANYEAGAAFTCSTYYSLE